MLLWVLLDVLLKPMFVLAMVVMLLVIPTAAVKVHLDCKIVTFLISRSPPFRLTFVQVNSMTGHLPVVCVNMLLLDNFHSVLPLH